MNQSKPFDNEDQGHSVNNRFVRDDGFACYDCSADIDESEVKLHGGLCSVCRKIQIAAQ